MREDVMLRSADDGSPRNGRYSAVAVALHWMIAALILYNLAIGFAVWDFGSHFFKQAAHKPLYFAALVSHISAGLTVLALTVLRIGWRLIHEPPAYPSDMKPWERHASHVTHFSLYAAMLLMPLIGWAMISANPPTGSPGWAALQASRSAPAPREQPRGKPQLGPPGALPPPPRVWWVLMPVPSIALLQNIGADPHGLKPQQEIHETLRKWHKAGAWLTLLLLLLHIAGALKHQWVDDQKELQRMWWGRRTTSPL